jgi:23S rRNA pseudouridine2605 synthase
MKERLQKIIAKAGIASRRAAEKMIQEGRVSVNRVSVRELGTKADINTDEIRVDGKLIFYEANESKIYLILHKPSGYITSVKDPQGRHIVMDLLPEGMNGVFPVGRLDYDSEGLLLMTNDGDFAHKIQHPKFSIPKTYRIKIMGKIADKEFRALEKGIVLSDGMFKPQTVQIEKVEKKSCWVMLTINEGRNRVIRRAFETLGYTVARLIRIAVSDIQLAGLKRGDYRYLTKKEVKKILDGSCIKDDK